MSILDKVGEIQRQLTEIQTLVTRNGSPIARESESFLQHHQTEWTSEIQHIISELAKHLCSLKKKFEVGPPDHARAQTRRLVADPPNHNPKSSAQLRPKSTTIVTLPRHHHNSNPASELHQEDDVERWISKPSALDASILTPIVTRANLHPPLLDRGRSPPSLSVEDMGAELAGNVARLMVDDSHHGIVSIMGLKEIDWTELMRSIGPAPEDHDFFGVVYSTTDDVDGVARVSLSTSRTLDFPDLSQPLQQPPYEACLDYLNQLIKSPPSTSISYYVGPSLYQGPNSCHFDSLLHPGEQLLESGYTLSGVNTVWWHAGKKGSGTAFHCEDAAFGSYNLVLKGWKLWILIHSSHTESFEKFVRKNWKSTQCEQFVRHHRLLISPETLEANGIMFDVQIAGPSDLVFTRPRQYHAVVNVTDCMAVAINFLPPGKPFLPDSVRVCNQCGLHDLDHPAIECLHCKSQKKVVARLNTAKKVAADDRMPLKRPTTRETSLANSRQKRSKSSHQGLDREDLRQVQLQLRAVDRLCKFPSTSRGMPGSKIFMLVAAIWSRIAVHQFCKLVQSTRDLTFITARLDLVGDQCQRVRQCAMGIVSSLRKSMLEKFLMRFNQLCLAEEVGKLCQGRLRLDRKVLKVLLSNTGMEYSQFEYHRAKGAKWKEICQSNKGLLCFILLERDNQLGISPDDYLNMKTDELQSFHELLRDDYTIAIGSAGTILQDSLNRKVMDMTFRWEVDGADMKKVPEGELLTSLQPFPSIVDNVFHPEIYPGWPRPDELSNSEDHCDLCEEDKCNCVELAVRTMPRIKNYGEKGFGLQAVTSVFGRPAYQTGAIIGQLLGELVPENTYSDGWAIEMVRKDGIACQIHCRNVGNCFRFLNHACSGHENARFESISVSGRYRIMIRACRDIQDGEEITVGYGRTYWKGRICLCAAHAAADV